MGFGGLPDLFILFFDGWAGRRAGGQAGRRAGGWVGRSIGESGGK